MRPSAKARSPRGARALLVAVVVLTGTGCSGADQSAGTVHLSTSVTSPGPTGSTGSTGSVATDRGGPSPSPGTTTGGASSATATPSPTGTVPPPRPAPPIVDPKAAVTASCVTTATTLSKAVTRWNAAVRARRTSALRAAAAGLKSAAKVVRVQARASKDRTFAKAAGAVATELDRAAASYAANRTVSGTSLNKAQQAMVSYCQKVI